MELKGLILYPGAKSVTFTDNLTNEKIGMESWIFKSGGGFISSHGNRNLRMTTARMTFETSDEPDSVQSFFKDQVASRSYYEVEARVPGKQYLRWDTPLKDVADMLGVIRGADDLDHPVTFRSLTIIAVKEYLPGSGTRGVTLGAIDLSILSETGGLRD
jgi:hypothetical protein